MTSEERTCEASSLVQSTLENSGFVANVEKSKWTPTMRLQWLGFMLDLSKGQIEIPQEEAAESLPATKAACEGVG